MVYGVVCSSLAGSLGDCAAGPLRFSPGIPYYHDRLTPTRHNDHASSSWSVPSTDMNHHMVRASVKLSAIVASLTDDPFRA